MRRLGSLAEEQEQYCRYTAKALELLPSETLPFAAIVCIAASMRASALLWLPAEMGDSCRDAGVGAHKGTKAQPP